MSAGFLFENGLNGPGQHFERIRFNETGLNEAWLRNTLHAQPDLIPLAEAFPATRGVSTVCTELPLAEGSSALSLDVFGVTPSGRPVLIECKLWRNPEARRRVVTQILEYSTILRTLTYGALEAVLKRRLGWTGENPLFQHVRERFPEIDEITFVEGVTRSLASGDFLLLIAGDGIRTDARTLVRLLEDTNLTGQLSMMEVKIWRNDADQKFFVAPTIPSRVDVERYRVYIGNDDRNVTFETDEADNPGQTDSAVNSDGPRRRNAAEIDAEKAFWRRLLDQLNFDNPEQECPAYRHPNNARAPFPSPAERLVIFRTKKGEVGVFVVMQRDENGRNLAASIEEQIDEIEEEMQLGLKMSNRVKSGAPYIIASTYLDIEAPDLEQQQAEWLKMASNRMVNALRPRIEQFNQLS